LKPDIVQAHTPKGGLLGMLAARAAGVRCRIYQMRGLPLMTARGLMRSLLTLTEQISCAQATRVICQSPSLMSAALEERLCAPERIGVVLKGSNGVDALGRFDPSRHAGRREGLRAQWGLPKDALVIGFVGRLVRDKGLVELWEAWQLLRSRIPTLHLLLAGPFEPRDPVPAEIVEALKSDARVHLVGFTADTPAVYAASDVVTLPSYREGFPNVPLEAAAMGLPVVATTIAGCVDAVEDEVTGLLVPARDSLALAGALERYASDSSLRRAHGQAGRARVCSEFQRERIWAAQLELYARELTGELPPQ
jgi:glycosyltransferase involved in cell wall biosynthesis